MSALWFAIALSSVQKDESRLPTGKFISPVGSHASVGSYPVNMVLSKGGKFAIVSTVGFREFLSVIDVKTGKVTDQIDFNGDAKSKDDAKPGLYFGLAVDEVSGKLYASNGAQDTITPFEVSVDGKLTQSGDILHLPSSENRGLPWHPTGLALTNDGKGLLVANNQTNDVSEFNGSFSVFDTVSGKETFHGNSPGFPFGVALVTMGAEHNRKGYIASERDGLVQVVDIIQGKTLKTIKVGAAPTCFEFNADQTKLYVSNASSDSISVINTKSDEVEGTILLRPAAMRGLTGVTPLGMSMSPKGTHLYVACADLNCIADVNTETNSVSGYIPTGWLPTSVIAVKGALLVASAKGVKAANPNHKPLMFPGLKSPDRYIQNIIDGTVSLIKKPTSEALKSDTAKVLANNFAQKEPTTSFKNPGIKHVIYIIKENRTYDNVLGDLKQGNGDPTQCMFPRKVTPNLHALAERFVLLDNFHVCAEVSQDGWMWSTAGMVSAYASRNTPYNYSDRGRNYDTEGSNNNVPVDLLDIPDVARPAGGYIWDDAAAHGVSFRNFGFFAQFDDPTDKRYDKDLFGEGKATKKALVKATDPDYRRYDNDYPDGDAYSLEGFSWPAMRKEYGAPHFTSRFQAWKSEFDKNVASDDFPAFEFVRFGNDHTQGTRENKPTPRSAAADNDYAVAQLVDAVSHSKHWKDTAIFVLEDDAQGGYDHVDCHRSTAYVISPYVKKSLVDSHFYNTDSFLRTMELILGLPPMNAYDATAPALDIFSSNAVNDAPYDAIKEDREIVCATNKATAYRAKDSAKISAFFEESEVDEDLNDILWGSIMGADTPRPNVRNLWTAAKRRHSTKKS